MKPPRARMKASIEESTAGALAKGTTSALVAMAFFAVLREGFETAVFLLAAFQASTTPLASGIGVVLGVATAIVLGYLIYRGGVRIDLARFFRVTGFVLVLVAAGLVAPRSTRRTRPDGSSPVRRRRCDLTWLVDPGSIRASLITGMLGLQPLAHRRRGRRLAAVRDPDVALRAVAPRRHGHVVPHPSSHLRPRRPLHDQAVPRRPVACSRSR